MNYDKLAGCGPLRGLAPLGPLKSIQIFKKYIKICAKGAVKGAAKGFRLPFWAI